MREQFPIFRAHPGLCYLDSAATAHKPEVVIKTLSRFYSEEYATVHRSVYQLSLQASDLYQAARERARAFLNAAHTEEILFTRGTTESLNLVATSLSELILQEGDEILLSEMEHHSNLVPWQIVAKKKGALLKFIPMDLQGALNWQGMITPKTKIISLAHISNVTGTINPIAEIAREAKAHGALFIVDGAQAAPHLLLDVQALGCDFYAFSGHKCYGPTGIGVLYGKKELLEKMPPIQGGGDMILNVTLQETTYAAPPLRFEAGTPPIAQAIGLKAALDWIDAQGKPAIASHSHQLRKLAEEKLLQIPHLQILGTTPNKAPLTTFHIPLIHPLDIATLLDLKEIAIRSGHLCAQPALRKFGLTSALRASFAVYNSEEDVERFAEAVAGAVMFLKDKR